MRRKKAIVNYGLAGFLIGGTIGTVLTFLFAPKTGRELRSDIGTGFNEYKDMAVDGSKKIYSSAVSYFNDVVLKSEQLRALSAKYLEGAYTVPRERVEKEIDNLRRALQAAIAAYRQAPGRNEDFDFRVNDIATEFEDETLPKHEGMGRRNS